MDRLADLETVLSATNMALDDKDWKGVERLSERVRSLVLDAAMWNDRDALERMRGRLLAFRSVASRMLDEGDPQQFATAILLRSDATLAALATRLRPRGVPVAAADQDMQTAAERVLACLCDAGSVTTTDIFEATELAQGTVSRLLTDLRARGLVKSKRVGKKVFSRLTPRGRAAVGARAVPRRAAAVTNRPDLLRGFATTNWDEILAAAAPMLGGPPAGFFDQLLSPVLSDLIGNDVPFDEMKVAL